MCGAPLAVPVPAGHDRCRWNSGCCAGCRPVPAPQKLIRCLTGAIAGRGGARAELRTRSSTCDRRLLPAANPQLAEDFKRVVQTRTLFRRHEPAATSTRLLMRRSVSARSAAASAVLHLLRSGGSGLRVAASFAISEYFTPVLLQGAWFNLFATFKRFGGSAQPVSAMCCHS
jgi:hypothetical protein